MAVKQCQPINSDILVHTTPQTTHPLSYRYCTSHTTVGD